LYYYSSAALCIAKLQLQLKCTATLLLVVLLLLLLLLAAAAAAAAAAHQSLHNLFVRSLNSTAQSSISPSATTWLQPEQI
jgi:hypothetical protein